MPNERGGHGSVYVFGAGGHGKVVADIAFEAGWRVEGFLDDSSRRQGSTVLGFPVVGGRERIPDLVREGQSIIAAVGSNVLRKQLQEELEGAGLRMATIISPFAHVSKWAAIGAGSVIMPGVIVNAGAVIGRGAIINSAAVVEHDCAVGDFTHLGPNCALGGGVRVGELSQVGIGASILPLVELGMHSVLGAGAVATRDLPGNVIAYGSPARIRQLMPPRHPAVSDAVNKL